MARFSSFRPSMPRTQSSAISLVWKSQNAKPGGWSIHAKSESRDRGVTQVLKTSVCSVVFGCNLGWRNPPTESEATANKRCKHGTLLSGAHTSVSGPNRAAARWGFQRSTTTTCSGRSMRVSMVLFGAKDNQPRIAAVCTDRAKGLMSMWVDDDRSWPRCAAVGDEFSVRFQGGVLSGLR